MVPRQFWRAASPGTASTTEETVCRDYMKERMTRVYLTVQRTGDETSGLVVAASYWLATACGITWSASSAVSFSGLQKRHPKATLLKLVRFHLLRCLDQSHLLIWDVMAVDSASEAALESLMKHRPQGCYREKLVAV